MVKYIRLERLLVERYAPNSVSFNIRNKEKVPPMAKILVEAYFGKMKQ